VALQLVLEPGEREACLRLLAGNVDLQQQRRRERLFGSDAVDAAQQLQRVDRVDRREGTSRLPSLVGLQASDQVPLPATAYWKRSEATPEPVSLAVPVSATVFWSGVPTAPSVGTAGAVLSIRREVTAVDVVTFATPSVATARKS
jgi:hypothetical protein